MARKRGYKKSNKKPARVKTWRYHLGNALIRGGTSGLKALKDVLGLNTENKNWDSTISQAATGTIASCSQPLSGLAQGNTNNTRNGNGLRMTHIKTRGILYNNVLNVDFQRFRFIVTFQPKVTTAGDYVAASELLQAPSNIDSPYNTDLQGCRILYDKTYYLKPNLTGQSVSTPFKFKWAPTYDMGHVTWTDSDTTGSVSNQLQGLLRYWIMTDAPTQRGSITAYTRIHYVDN